MSACRWDREAETYLTDDGRPCKRDDYGDPTHHCTARRTCPQHIGASDHTCARCIGRTRQDLRVIRDFSALLPYAAMNDGVNSEAANLAGPSTDPRQYSERRVATLTHLLAFNALGRITDEQYAKARRIMDDDDPWHPYGVTTRWQMMLAWDWNHPLPAKLGIVNACGYLDRNLGRLAQADDQDFPLFRYEISRCRTHLITVLHDSPRGLRGAPCPECVATGKVDPKDVRMRCEFAHYCDEEDCDQINHDTDEADVWVCPQNKNHWMTAEGYRLWIEERAAC